MEQGVPRAALALMEVENIVAASFGENGKRCYKVQWKDSWVFEDHLFSCKDLVEKFWKEQKKAEESVVQHENPNSSGIKRTSKGQPKKDVTTVIVIGNKETENVSDSVPSNSEIDGDWMLDSLGTDEEAKENDGWFVTSQTKKIRPSGSKYTLACHMCEEEFELVSAFRRHYNDMHPGVKPFACDMCSKRFDRKENLNRHVRIHTGDRRYICNFCGKGYTDPSGLKKHVIAKHNLTKFPCDVCQAVLASKDLYHRHIAKHINEYKLKKHCDEQNNVGNSSTSKKPLIENNVHDNNDGDDENSTIQVLMEDAREDDNHAETTTTIIERTDTHLDKDEPIQNVVHQLQQYVDGHGIQYVQVTPSTAEEEQPSSSALFPTNQTPGEQHFVIPITSPQILSINSSSQDSTQVLPVQVTGDQQIITVPIASTQTFVYTGSISEATGHGKTNEHTAMITTDD